MRLDGRRSDRGRRLGYSLLVVMPPILLASIASVSLHYAFWSVAKSFYALALTPTVQVGVWTPELPLARLIIGG